MQVYIEYVILNNLLINALILVLTLRFMRYKINKIALLFASTIGVSYAVFLPIFDIMNIFILKVVLSLVMVATVMGRCRLKRYLCACAIFFAITFSLGGAVIGISSMLSYELSELSSSLIPFYVAVAGLGALCMQRLISKYVTLARRKSKYEENVVLAANGVEVECKAYYDSGNRLYYKNKPTIIIDESIALRLYGQNELIKLDSFTQIDTVTGKKQMQVVPIDYLREEKKGDKIYGVSAAISRHIKGEYKVVSHCDL